MIPTIVGTASQCKEKLQALQERFEVNEIIFLDVCHKLEDLLRSYELLASEFGLGDFLSNNGSKSNESNVARKNRRLVSSGLTRD